MTALLAIDIQNDFLPGGGLGVDGGDQIVSVVNELIPLFRLVVATQDWHPAHHLSFADNHQGARPGDIMNVKGVSQILWPRHCVQEGPGAAFAEGLNHGTFARVVFKGTDPEIDSYSAFFDNARLKETELDAYLQSKRVKTLFVAGLATDYCVLYSVLDALELGYTVYVIADACRAVNLSRTDGDDALHRMKELGARVVTSDEILNGALALPR